MIKATINKAHFSCLVTNEKHEVIADEPAILGGTDKGLTPKELLMSALGSCVAITLRMYVDRKQWPVDKIEVNISMGIENAENIFFEEITCTGALTDDQKQRLEVIAKMCPVSKILAAGNELRSKVL